MKIFRPSPSMVVAGLALFVSLGGTSDRGRELCVATPAPSMARAPSSPRVAQRPPASSWRPNRSGADTGRFPGKFIADVARP